jgi:hypothetical protein
MHVYWSMAHLLLCHSMNRWKPAMLHRKPKAEKPQAKRHQPKTKATMQQP